MFRCSSPMGKATVFLLINPSRIAPAGGIGYNWLAMTLLTPHPPPPAAPRFRSAEEWWDSLGRVPLHRIVFDPLPGTATEADVLRLDDHEDRLCELIDGTLVEKA